MTYFFFFSIYLQYCGTFVAAVVRQHPAVLGRISGVKDGCYTKKSSRFRGSLRQQMGKSRWRCVRKTKAVLISAKFVAGHSGCAEEWRPRLLENGAVGSLDACWQGAAEPLCARGCVLGLQLPASWRACREGLQGI